VTKKITKNEIEKLLNKIDGLDDTSKHKDFKKILTQAAEKMEEVQKEYVPKLNELYKKKAGIIKDFMRNMLPKFRKKAEVTQSEADKETAEKLLENL
jgi:flagellar hook-basal body complex protein FliE